MAEDEKVEDLGPDKLADLEACRAWVREQTSAPRPTETSSDKVRLIGEILESGSVQPHERQKLHALGVVLGDALAQEIPGMAWKMVTNQLGRHLALVYRDISITLLPVTMISRRLEKGEPVQIGDLFTATCAHVQEVLQRPDLDSRPQQQSQPSQPKPQGWLSRLFGRGEAGR
jgi:hypothetical protein